MKSTKSTANLQDQVTATPMGREPANGTPAGAHRINEARLMSGNTVRQVTLSKKATNLTSPTAQSLAHSKAGSTSPITYQKAQKAVRGSDNFQKTSLLHLLNSRQATKQLVASATSPILAHQARPIAQNYMTNHI